MLSVLGTSGSRERDGKVVDKEEELLTMRKEGCMIAGQRGERSSTTSRLGRILRGGVALSAVLGAVSLSVSAGASGVAGAASKRRASTTGTTKITIAYTAPVSTQLLPQVTESAGLFKKYGITATVTYLPEDEAKSELVSGGVQFVDITAPGPEGLRAEGYSAAWVAIWAKYTTIEILGNKGVTSLSDVATKVAGETAAGAPTSILSQILFKQAGVLTKVHLEPLGSVGAIDSAFEAGTVDTDPIAPPTATAVLKATPGSSVLVNLAKKKNFAWPGSEIVAMTTWASSHEKATVDVLKALIAGDKYMQTPKNETAVVKVIETATKASPATSKASYAVVTKQLKATTSLAPSLSVEKKVLEEYGVVTPNVKNVKASAVISTKYVNEAYKALKKGNKKHGKLKANKKQGKK